MAVVLLGSFGGCGHVPQRQELRAPSILPNTTRQMKTAGFWIARVNEPDRVILTQPDIAALNARNQDAKLTEDIILIQTPVKGKDVAAGLRKSLSAIRKQSLSLGSGEKAGDEFFDPVLQLMDLGSVPEKVSLRYGLAVHYTDQRILPTMNALYAQQGDVDFDELQNSGLDVGTPIVILHQSRDGQWLYGRTQLSTGWVQAQDVAIASLDDIRRYSAREQFIVVTVPKADVFLDQELTQYADYVRMGSLLPLVRENGKTVVVRTPARNAEGALLEISGYLKAEQVSVGFLPYTARNMMEQAFKMLNSPYGWGGMYGEQDCSRFIQEVFSTVGIVMPRNSGQQAKVGVLAATFSDRDDPDVKAGALQQQAVGGITTLYMKGHIMLYLGAVDGRSFAIHAPWGYREACPQKANSRECRQDTVRVMNRVVVSDLSLGQGSRKGSLIERLLSVRRVE